MIIPRPHCSQVAGATPKRQPLDPLALSLKAAVSPQQKMLDLQDIQAIPNVGPVFVLDEALVGQVLAYEDSAGTTPVRTGGACGLLLDVSKGLALGPELVTNGTFDTNAGWVTQTVNEFNFSEIAAGSCRIVSDDTSVKIETTAPILNSNKFYLLSFSHNVNSLNGVKLIRDNSTEISFRASGYISAVISGISNALRFWRIGGGATNSTLDNISVREVLGAHAIQSTTANKSKKLITPSTGLAWLNADTATAAMTVTLPSAITSATVFQATPTGVTKTTGVNLGTSFSITSPYQWFSGYVAVNGTTTAAEDALITRFLNRYVPVLGNEKFTNNDFSQWSGDNPIDWHVPTENGTNYVTQDALGARLVSDGASMSITQNILTVGKTYILVSDIKSVIGSAKITLGTYEKVFTTPGVYKVTAVTDSISSNAIRRNSACNVVISSASIKEIL